MTAYKTANEVPTRILKKSSRLLDQRESAMKWAVTANEELPRNTRCRVVIRAGAKGAIIRSKMIKSNEIEFLVNNSEREKLELTPRQYLIRVYVMPKNKAGIINEGNWCYFVQNAYPVFDFDEIVGENPSRVLTFQEVLRSYGGYPQNNETFVICKKAEGWGNHFVAVSEWNPTEPINLLSRK